MDIIDSAHWIRVFIIRIVNYGAGDFSGGVVDVFSINWSFDIQITDKSQ